jgi:hypothetical protein
MLEFGMSKRQVLTEFYIREIPLLTHVITDRVRTRQLRKLNDYSMMLKIATLTCGLKPDVDGVNKLFSSFCKQSRELLPTGFEDLGVAVGTGKPQDPYKRLEELQKRMAGARKGMVLKN